ncbi:uncharacterized protein [Drosophila tropicalis]|uniref:uncharacterized protein n=1 Tax=Drosophila tropicalis TaxID=46794 RepID=UPI0035ABBDF3
MRTLIIAIGILGLFVSYHRPFGEAVIFKLTNAVCKSYNESWIVINKCRLKALGRDKTAFYFNGTVKHPAYDISVKGQLYKKANVYMPWLLKANIDACRFVDKPYNPIAILVANLFLEFTNFNHSCPYVGSKIIDGFYLRPDMLRLPFPTGDYKLTLRWSYDKRLQFDTNLSFQFVENLIDQ